MSSDQDTRVAVVTGGSGGIGGAIVGQLRSTGHRTAVIDRTGVSIVIYRLKPQRGEPLHK